MTEAANPYQPPKADAPIGPPTLGSVERPRPPMPGTVIASIVIISVYLLIILLGALANPVAAAIQAGLAVLIMVGLVRRHALAWQWGMIIPVLGAIATGLSAVTALSTGLGAGVIAAVVLLVMMAIQLSIPILLSRRGSRLFFGLQCPSCQSMKVKAANFVFSAYKCKSCGASWRY